MKDADQAMNPLEDIAVVPEPSEKLLNQRQLIDYRTERENCLEWLLAFGKDPSRVEGYAMGTVSNRASRMDQFYRWVWEQEGGYTSGVTNEHADGYLQYLAHRECSNAHKNACRKAVMMLYKWRHHQRGAEKWDPAITFSRRNQSTAPRDYLTRKERTKIRDAALEHGSVPRYENTHGEERVRWKREFGYRRHEATTLPVIIAFLLSVRQRSMPQTLMWSSSSTRASTGRRLVTFSAVPESVTISCYWSVRNDVGIG